MATGSHMTKCNNCRHAEWQLTKHKPPRVNKRDPGRCRVPHADIFAVLPISILENYSDLSRECIRWDREHDRPCPFFKPLEAGK
jgi:hypothetical protein